MTIVLAVAGWVATELTGRASLALPVLPLSSLSTMGLIVVVAWILGLKVRRWRNGNRDKHLDPLLAARTLVLAQACAYAGAVLLGWHAGILLNQLPTLSLRTDLGIVGQIAAVMGGGVAMIVTGLIVERFCKLPPEDTDATPPNRARREGHGKEEFA
ncbi:DUF3180 domain-containing protein [Specibacter sp. RAF43]|uniref:DUF3180 domain-containing protein n=1 Tax=Specibacter sp. RAF43 TaxID=3233057 RepID=UPI003F963085